MFEDTSALLASGRQYYENLTERHVGLLCSYAKAVLEKNEVMNLTAITDPEAFWQRHILDSLACSALPECHGKVADVGTGAGFPGAVIAVVRDDARVTMIDSTQKKLTFVQSSCDELGIAAKTLHARAEELAHKAEYRERYDFITARAVANLASLVELCLPLVRVGGYFAAMKGPDAAEELAAAKKAISLLGGTVRRSEKYTLPGGDVREIIIIEKTAPTPQKYPRAGAKISKKPLA